MFFATLAGCSILQKPLFFAGKTHVLGVFMRFSREIRMFFIECVSCLFSSRFRTSRTFRPCFLGFCAFL
jgi:hypothetical protein